MMGLKYLTNAVSDTKVEKSQAGSMPMPYKSERAPAVAGTLYLIKVVLPMVVISLYLSGSWRAPDGSGALAGH